MRAGAVLLAAAGLPAACAAAPRPRAARAGGRSGADPPPNIIHIVADDMGSNDGSWNDGLPGRGGPAQNARTPHLAELAHGGVCLGHFYTFKMCAPSRAMILTGRYTFHFGYYENRDADGATGGVPPALKMTPYDLKKAGYKTHAIGKWHGGYRTKLQTPPWKGFDSWLGYFHYGENYFTQVYGGGGGTGSECLDTDRCCGVDFTESDAAETLRRSPRNGSAATYGHDVGSYSTYQYAGRAVDIITEHDPADPLYIYLAFQNVHGPTEAPPRFAEPFPAAMHPQRRKVAACLSALDKGVENVTSALKRRGMYSNTVIAFQSDNGGPEGNDGAGNNNYPLRGGKFTLWEGGTRVIAFVHSPLLPAAVRGTVWGGLSHSTDWRPTFAALAGVAPDASGSPFPLDGHNLWPALAAGAESPRTEVVHTIIKPPYNNKTCHTGAWPCFWGPGIVNAGAAIRQQQWKLVIGYGGHPDVAAVLPQLQQPYNATAQPVDGFDPASPAVKCADHCLFDVVADPSEDHDVKAEHPDIVQRLLARMDALAAEGQPQLSTDVDERDCQGVEETGYFFPYQD